MDFEKKDAIPATVTESKENNIQRVRQIMNEAKRQFGKECSRDVVVTQNEVPSLDDETIGYKRLQWRLCKKWFARCKSWVYGIQYQISKTRLFKTAIWSYLTKSQTEQVDIKDEPMRIDARLMMRLVEQDPTFDDNCVWFKDQSSATAFIEVYEAYRRDMLLTSYLQTHPEYIYL